MNFWNIYYDQYEGIRKFILALVKDEWAADDLVQETFIKVRKNAGQLKDETKLKPWIYRIAHNLCQDHFRQTANRIKRQKPISDGLAIQIQPQFHRQIEQQQMAQCVQDKIRLLPETYQTVLVLFDMMEFSHQEIARILDTSVENVKVRLHRARKKLKAILDQKCRMEMDERSVLVCTPVEEVGYPKQRQL